MRIQRLTLVSEPHLSEPPLAQADPSGIPPQSSVRYECTAGHRFTLRYSDEAETIPKQVGCRRCHKLSQATTPDRRLVDVLDDVANSPAARRRVSPLRSLHMRRSETELQELLDAALDGLRGAPYASGATQGAQQQQHVG